MQVECLFNLDCIDQRVLKWRTCSDVMDSLAAALSGQDSAFPGAAFVRIDGSTDAIDRRAAVARFRDDPNISVALLSITAAGASHT